MTGGVCVSVEPDNDILAASEVSKKIDNSSGRLLEQRKYTPCLIMAILMPFSQQFSGMNVLLFYAPVIFKTLGFGNSTALVSAVIIFIAYMLTAITSFYVKNKIRTKFFMLAGGVQMAVFQFVLGGLIWNKFGVDSTAKISESYAQLVVLCYCEIVAGFAWSCGPLGWLVPSEIFPLEVRSALQCINVFLNVFFTFVVAQIFLKMLEIFKFGLFFFFGGFGIIMSIFVYFFLPETKGIPIEEMSQVWKSHWYWKRLTDGDDFELEEKKVQ